MDMISIHEMYHSTWFLIDQMLEEPDREKRDRSLPGISAHFLTETLPPDPAFMASKLDPGNYDWVVGNEYPPLEWIASALTCYALFGKLSREYYHLYLKAINYHGLFTMVDLVTPDCDDMAYFKKDFNYNKAVAKHFKNKGDTENAIKYYRKAVKVAAARKDDELKAYSLILVAKLYSDYWQRKGLYRSFTEIVYNRIKDNHYARSTRWYQICMDSYAKEFFVKQPELATGIFVTLLAQKDYTPDVYYRIRFRFLEAIMTLRLEEGKIIALTEPLKEYQELLTRVQNNPKATYIRNIHLLRFFRKIAESGELYYAKSAWLKSRINFLRSGGAIDIAKQCIQKAKQFSDLKFVALGYYEYAQWIEDTDMDYRLQEKIKCLINGYSYFSNANSGAFVNNTYIKIIQGLAMLYVEKKDWDKALFFYDQLYKKINTLTASLENDTLVINKLLDEKPSGIKAEYPEFGFLLLAELRQIKDSLIIDYANLTRKLISHGDNMVSIQKHRLNSFFEVIDGYKKLITHDINYNLVFLGEQIERISNVLGVDGSAFVDPARHELQRAQNNLDRFSGLVLNETLSDKTIDIAEGISEYVSFFTKNYSNNIKIRFTPRQIDGIKLPGFLLDRILNNLVTNAIHVGLKNKIQTIIIEFTLGVERDCVYLIVKDNCGDIGKLKTAVANLNNNKQVHSIKNASQRGQGLLAVKASLDDAVKLQNKKWAVLSTNSLSKKFLKIPIGRIINSL